MSPKKVGYGEKIGMKARELKAKGKRAVSRAKKAVREMPSRTEKGITAIGVLRSLRGGK